VLYGWDRRPTSTPLAAERLAGAMRGGLRYVRYQPELRAVMVRAGGFMFFSIALMALCRCSRAACSGSVRRATA
jgi:hypothetical protein